MGVLRKILVFVLITSLLILLGRLAGRYLPPRGGSASPGASGGSDAEASADTTNAQTVSIEIDDVTANTGSAPFSVVCVLGNARNQPIAQPT